MHYSYASLNNAMTPWMCICGHMSYIVLVWNLCMVTLLNLMYMEYGSLVSKARKVLC